MAYYGGFGSNQVYPQSFPSTGLASYAGSNAFQVNQPAYYAGPSYSTTSDNDFLNALPVAGYGTSAYGTGYGTNLGSYGASPFDPLAQQQQQQQAQTAQQQASQQQVQTRSFSQQKSTHETDLSQLEPQIEAAYEAATGQRRQPVIKRQVITIPGAPGKVQQIVRRLPTPTPDVVERVFVVKPQRDIVNLVIERPETPPAQYKDKTIMGKSRKPVINPLIVRVAARSQHQVNYPCIQALPAPTTSVHYQQQPQQQTQTGGSQAAHQQPSLSTQQYSQASTSQMSQTHLGKGYVIAPIQYEDSQPIQTSQSMQQPLQQPQQTQTQTMTQPPVQQTQPLTPQANLSGVFNYPGLSYPQPSYPNFFGSVYPPMNIPPNSFPSSFPNFARVY